MIYLYYDKFFWRKKTTVRIKKRHYVFVFLLALLLGTVLKGMERDSFEIIKNSTAYAPKNEMVYLGESSIEKININTANVYELNELNGIGDSLAKRIVDYRTKNGDFEVIEDIMKVSGIGEKTFEEIKNSICVE